MENHRSDPGYFNGIPVYPGHQRPVVYPGHQRPVVYPAKTHEETAYAYRDSPSGHTSTSKFS